MPLGEERKSVNVGDSVGSFWIGVWVTLVYWGLGRAGDAWYLKKDLFVKLGLIS